MKEFIEKLIGRLEEYEQSHLIAHDSELCKHCQGMDCLETSEDCTICVMNKAIEIVQEIEKEYINKSTDYCEWKLIDEEANVYDTSCRNPHILLEGSPIDNNYEFCPYCGKKIKVEGVTENEQ